MQLIRRRPSLGGSIALVIALITASGFLFFKSEIQRREKAFSDYTQKIASAVHNQLTTNDAVLAGFSAFLQAVDQSDTQATDRYAAAVLGAYPHIYMMEVAREVESGEQPGLQALLQETWKAGFELKDFPSVARQPVSDLGRLGASWPILFMYPPMPEAEQIYGVRLETVPYLSYALARSQNHTAAVASPVFTMYEGGSAYILLQSVSKQAEDVPHVAPNFFGSAMVALLLVKTDSIRSAVMPVDGDPLVKVTATLETAEAESVVVQVTGAQPGWLDAVLLPRLTAQLESGSASQPVKLTFERQVRLSDIFDAENALILITLLTGIILVPVLLIRHFIAIEQIETDYKRSSYLSTHDTLTELPNRYLLTAKFEQALTKWSQDGVPFGVLLIDLDHFKLINDQHGHAVGDEVLRLLATRLRYCMRLSDTVARLGGDEFVALVPGLREPDRAKSKAQQLLHAIEQPISTTAGVLELSCSIGAALCPAHGRDLTTLLKAADQAMYRVKGSGRGGIEVRTLNGVS